MPKVSWHILLAVLAASAGTAFFVDTWPLVDGIALVTGAFSLGGLALKLGGKVRG